VSASPGPEFTFLPWSISDGGACTGGLPQGPVLSVSDSSGLERDSVTGSVFVPVTLSKASATPTVVSFYTVDGTAIAGQDYTRWGTPAVPRTVTLPAGVLQGTINVPVLADAAIEGDETFSVVVSGVSGGDVTLGNDTGVATIVDADVLESSNPAITVSNGTIYEGDDGQRRAQFQIHLSKPANTLTVAYTTEDGTAVAGTDYKAILPGTVVFAPGQISRTIDVIVFSNTDAGSSRDFKLNLSVTGGPSVEELNMSGVTTILDDD
jgi:hypothetical protein